MLCSAFFRFQTSWIQYQVAPNLELCIQFQKVLKVSHKSALYCSL